MKDCVDEASDQVALWPVSEEEPVILNFEQHAAETEVCQYCGHCPCGCGG